jgi:hypothetical protein
LIKNALLVPCWKSVRRSLRRVCLLSIFFEEILEASHFSLFNDALLLPLLQIPFDLLAASYLFLPQEPGSLSDRLIRVVTEVKSRLRAPDVSNFIIDCLDSMTLSVYLHSLDSRWRAPSVITFMVFAARLNASVEIHFDVVPSEQHFPIPLDAGFKNRRIRIS